MHKLLLISVIALLILMSGCAKVQVSQDYALDFQFGSNGSFGWNLQIMEENSGLLQQDELLANRFKRAIETVLATRGFHQGDSPEILVSCSYSVSKMLQAEPVSSGFGYGFGRYGRYGTVGIYSGTSIRQYQQGLLVINIHEGHTGRLVWKGVGTREVFTHANPDDVSTMVYEMVEAVLNQFPPNH